MEADEFLLSERQKPPGMSPGSRAISPIATMNQLPLQLIGRLDAPSLVPPSEIAKIKTYREACRWCWAYRRSTGMTKATLAELTGMRPSHLNDYLSPDQAGKPGTAQRDMPAKYITSLERVAGNTCITQWLAMQSKLTVLELVLAAHVAA